MYDLDNLINEFETYSKKSLITCLRQEILRYFTTISRMTPMFQYQKVYWELTTKKIITMSYVTGVKISDVADFANTAAT